MERQPAVSSFVLRFVQTEPADTGDAWAKYRGTIRHVQSNEEIHFIDWQEAQDFIARFVPLNSPKNTEVDP